MKSEIPAISKVVGRAATAMVFALLSWGAGGAAAHDWPAWRGATGLGYCLEVDLPLTWSTTENVKWKAPLPAPGNSTPIVWGRRVLVTQATEKGKRRALLCFDRADGKVQWEKAVEHSEREPTHDTNPYCAASPATDGERVIVSHGSAGVFCYDLEGRELWRREVGKLHHIWGNASSPVIAGDLCFLNCGPGDRTFLLAVEKKTGKPVWQVDIPGGREGGESSTWTGSWSTPLLFREGGREELLVSYPHRLRAFVPATGAEIWSADGLGNLVYTSPVAGEGVVIAMSGYGGPSLGVRAGGQGDVTATHRLWRQDKAQQRIGSGIIRDGHLYFVNDPGIAECLELKTGKTVWKERIGSTCWSSMILSGDRLYVPDEAGDCHVVRASTRFERLAKNSLGELIRASFAVSDGDIFIRTYKHLWCIGARKGTGAASSGPAEKK